MPSSKKRLSKFKLSVGLLAALLLILLLYLFLGSLWIRSTARAAHLPDPTSPYEEIIKGQGQCKPLRLTVLGDSTAIGTGTSSRQGTFSYQIIKDLFLARYSAVEYRNRAVSGATIEDVLNRQLSAALSDQSELVLISIGANDVTGFTSAEAFRASLGRVLDQLTAQTPARVVVLGVPAVYSAPVLLPLFPNLLDFFTRRLIEAEDATLTAYSPARVSKVDIYHTTGPIFVAHPEYFAADHYHPNDQGYAVWAGEVAKVLQADFKAEC